MPNTNPRKVVEDALSKYEAERQAVLADAEAAAAEYPTVKADLDTAAAALEDLRPGYEKALADYREAKHAHGRVRRRMDKTMAPRTEPDPWLETNADDYPDPYPPA